MPTTGDIVSRRYEIRARTAMTTCLCTGDDNNGHGDDGTTTRETMTTAEAAGRNAGAARTIVRPRSVVVVYGRRRRLGALDSYNNTTRTKTCDMHRFWTSRCGGNGGDDDAVVRGSVVEYLFFTLSPFGVRTTFIVPGGGYFI